MATNTTTKAEVPHFSLPLRFVGGKPAVNEQDSWDDVYDSVQAVARFRKGDRDDMPDLGISPPEFTVISSGPAATAIMEAEIAEWEPRIALHSGWEDVLADLSASITVQVEEPNA